MEEFHRSLEVRLRPCACLCVCRVQPGEHERVGERKEGRKKEGTDGSFGGGEGDEAGLSGEG